MRLDEYLIQVETSFQEDLTKELGIVNNWPILLKIDLDLLINHFEDSNKYRIHNRISWGQYTIWSR